MRKRFPCSIFLALAVISTLTLQPLQQADALRAPTFGLPDIHIDLRQPSSDLISLDDNNFGLILNDLRKLPALFQDEIMPNLRNVLLTHEDELVGRYIQYISVQHDMDGTTRIEIVTQPDTFPDQTIEIDSKVSPTITTLRYVQVSLVMSVNSTTPEMYHSMISRLEELNLMRIELLSNHAIETFTTYRDRLQNFSPTGEPISPDADNVEAAIGLIVLKMVDTDLARTTVFYPVNESGNQGIAIDEIKSVSLFSDDPGLKIRSPPVMRDSSFNELTSALVGQQLILSTGFSNTGDTELEYVSLTEARNETGVTVFLESRWGKLNSGENAEIRHIWRPGESGTFELRSFLVSADCFPEILAPVNIGKVVVKPLDGSQTPIPRLEDLTTEEIQRLTKEEIEAFELEDHRLSEIDSEVSDAEDQRIEAKERRVRDLIWSDERIRGYQETFAVFGFDSHFVMDEQGLCDDAEMTIHVARERQVEGDWQTSYISTLSGRLELNVTVIDGAISSIAVNPLNDTTSEHFFTEEQKEAIRIAVEDDSVQELFQDKEMEIGVVRLTGVSFSGCEEICGIAVIYQKEDREKAVAVRLDLSNERVTSIRPTLKWISEEPERALAAVKNGQYLIEVSFNDPIGKATFDRIGSDYGIQIEYFEYIATRNITGGASTEVFTNLEQLEDDLMNRHDAMLIGITEIGARGTSEDWLKFLEGILGNISEINVVQVLG